MIRNRWFHWTLAAGLLVLLSVFCYNYWSLCRGHCTLRTFFNLGPFGWLLLLLNGAALTLWLQLRHRNLRRRLGQRCACGQPLASGWRFCPNCGTQPPSVPLPAGS